MTGFTPEVLHEFRRYNWPGNIGELAEMIRAIREAAASPLVRLGDLPFRFRTGMDAQRIPPAEETQVVPLDELLERTEREQIEAALSRAGGNKSIAADLLRIPRAKLYRRMEAAGLGGEPRQRRTSESGRGFAERNVERRACRRSIPCSNPTCRGSRGQGSHPLAAGGASMRNRGQQRTSLLWNPR